MIAAWALTDEPE